ncbi:hypothetical protein I8519_003189, partial [Proteus mirabilis]
ILFVKYSLIVTTNNIKNKYKLTFFTLLEPIPNINKKLKNNIYTKPLPEYFFKKEIKYTELNINKIQ